MRSKILVRVFLEPQRKFLPRVFLVFTLEELIWPSLLLPIASVQTITKGQAGSRIVSKGRTGKLAVFPFIPPFKRQIPSAITHPSAQAVF